MSPVKEKEKPIDTVRKLIQLSSSASRAEADASAYRACALIRKHGLEIVDPNEIDAILQESSELKKKVMLLEAGADDDEGFGPRVAASASFIYTSTAGYAPQPPKSSAGHPPFCSCQSCNPVYHSWVKSPQQATKTPMSRPVPLQSKYAGQKCLKCGKAINMGDPILWQKDVGIWCQTTSCYPDWAALQNFNPVSP